jgi:HEXXH motif-containing protein
MQDTNRSEFDSFLRSPEFDRLHLISFWKRRHLEFVALTRLVELECPELAARVDLGQARQALVATDLQKNSVLRSPCFVAWVSVLRLLVMRNTHRSLPTGHVEDHLLDLHRFALAAASLDDTSYECRLRIPQDGRLFLPGLGLMFAVRRRYSGDSVRFETDGRTLTAIVESRRWQVDREGSGVRATLAGVPGWSRVDRLGWGICLDNSLEMSYVHRSGNPTWKMQNLTPDRLKIWMNLVGEACRLISAVEETLWVPVRALLSSLFPLESPCDRILSGTAPEALGCIASSPPPNAALLAESLTHEAAHTQLHVLVDEQRFWTPDGVGGVYRSPWRDDLRPISGMIHGIFAFLGVGELWALLLERELLDELEDLGKKRLRTVALQVQEALAEVANSGELTEAGRNLLTWAERKTSNLVHLSRIYAPRPQSDKAIAAALIEHRKRLPVFHHLSFRKVTSAPDREWSHELGVTMPPPANRRADGVAHRESISDRIQVAAFNAEPVVDRLKALALTIGCCEPESTALVRGSICYGQGDFLQAVRFYTDYVELRWEDLDAWRLLASALRRVDRFLDAMVIVFNLNVIIDMGSSTHLRQQWGADWPFHLSELPSFSHPIKLNDISHSGG